MPIIEKEGEEDGKGSMPYIGKSTLTGEEKASIPQKGKSTGM